MTSQIDAGAPYPRGATWDGKGVNFALFSANAEKVELCLFNADGTRETARLTLPEYTDQVWHGYVPGLTPGAVYGYRVHGPYAPRDGLRFNAHKLLLDPYAKAHQGTLQWDGAVFGYTIGHKDGDLSFDTRDSARFMPKCVVVDAGFDWPETPPGPLVPWDRTVIYETHVRGHTMRHPKLSKDKRGTYAGMAAKEVTRHLKDLGVTTVELLPVHSFVNDQFLLDRGLTNYWGYNTIGYFAPDPRYAADPRKALREFKDMVARFHDAGLEVILDVVYNHTAEGNENGPTLSFRGIDNLSYYRLMPDDKRYYINDTGTGNTLNMSHPRVLQMVMDSLRYWTLEGHVDGFRFDLGLALARGKDGFDRRSAFLQACAQDPVLATRKLIAEPWDCGPGGYATSDFPPGWAEWNDKFRDTVRDFWRQEAAPGEFAARITASADLFDARGRRPWSSVNFITAHDGFTLRDLVTYNDKHNDANGDDNKDGHADNRSWNCGAEGETQDAGIIALRERQMRNFLATLLLSQGTPMLLGGDEFGHGKGGNNNSYCQDNDISWLDWDHDAAAQDMVRFTRRLCALRAEYPALRRNRFRTDEDTVWIRADGQTMTEKDWADGNMRCFGVILKAQTDMALFFNAYHDVVRITLPEGAWTRLIDTNLPQDEDVPAFKGGAGYDMTARSLLLFKKD